MKKRIVVFSILSLVVSGFGAGAQVKLKDVPDDHWATGAVYDLVKMGITKGFPDGTFRGDKPINRYETAIFLSKLAKAIGGEDLKAEIKALRDQIVSLKKESLGGVSLIGNYWGNWKIGNLLSAPGSLRAAIASYRLKLSVAREFDENASFRINLDTMDYGFFDDGTAARAGRGQLSSELIDIETNLKLDLSEWRFSRPVNLKLSYGPGVKQHSADPTGSLPSEVESVYSRPRTGILASTDLLGLNVSGSYYSVQGSNLDLSGKVNTGWLSGAVSYTFSRFLMLNNFKVDFIGDYISKGLFSTSDRSLKFKVGVFAPLGEKAQASAAVGVGRTANKMMVAGDLTLNDPLETGTIVTIKAARVGTNYIDPNFNGENFYLAGNDNFDRPLVNGIVNIGGELTQAVSDKATLIGKGDIRLGGDYKYQGAKARLTAQGGLSYKIGPNVNFDAAYRVHQDKATGDTSDLAAVGLMYKF